MGNNKYSSNNENKLSNTKIELRKEVLNDVRALCDKVKEERYSEHEFKILIQELKEIAEMIRDKDSMMEVRQELKSRKSTIRNSEAIIEVRNRIMEQIKNKKDITVNQYDAEELEVILQEVKEMIELIQDKDVIMKALEQKKVEVQFGENKSVSKFFKFNEPEEK